MAQTDAQLVREIDEANKGRARLYWLIYDELRAELGPERAEALLARAIGKRGAEVGTAMFAGLAERNPRTVADAFLSASPAGGTLFPHTRRDRDDGNVEIAVHRCPLKDAWHEAGLNPVDIATMCRIAGRFDHGCFGAGGVALAAETWTPGREGCCRLTLLSD
jgi:hypothetical protein